MNRALGPGQPGTLLMIVALCDITDYSRAYKAVHEARAQCCRRHSCGAASVAALPVWGRYVKARLREWETAPQHTASQALLYA